MLLSGIALKSAKRAPMQECESAEITVEAGIVGDRHGGGGLLRRRQLTLLSSDQWQVVCRELQQALPWTTRRANLYIDGIVFGPRDKLATVLIGSGVELQITGETKPCKRMDEAYQGLRQVLTSGWRAGVTCRVVRGGVLRVGDPIRCVGWRPPEFPGET